MPSEVETEVAVIGAGPAGIAAAVQLRRAGIPFVILEQDRVGGLLWNANLVENYPGFPRGIPGPELVALLEIQLGRLGIDVAHEKAECLDFDGRGLRLDASRQTYRPRRVVIASGTRPLPFPLPIPGEARDRVVHDVVPLLGVRGKEVLIIGAGDAAFDHALNLAKNGNSVTIFNRGREVKCLPLLRERAEAESSIRYRPGIAVKGIAAGGPGGRLNIECEREGRLERTEVDYLIFAIGREPRLEFPSARLRAEEADLARAGRLYYIGDVRNGRFRQMAIAVGDGLRAGLRIYSEIEEEGR